MWHREMCVHLYDLLDVLAAKTKAKATATTEATATTAAAKKTKESAVDNPRGRPLLFLLPPL